MAVYVLLMAVLVHLPRATGADSGFAGMTGNISADRELEMVNVFRNIMVTAALMAFAKYVAKDKRIIS